MKLKLIEKKKEAEDVTSFIFQPDEPITWQAGQYLHYLLPHELPDDRGIERWFTISSAPFEKQIRLTTRLAERSSTFKKVLFDLPLESEIKVDGPDGDFVVSDPESEHVFIAGGIGITPYRSILLDMDARGISINAKLLYSNHDENFLFKDELEALKAKHPNFSIYYFVSPKHIDAEAISQIVPEKATPVFYISGPAPMVFAFEKTLHDMQIPKEHIKLDDFPGYE